MCTYFIVYTYIANISYISNTKILQEIWMHISNHMAATPPNHVCKIHKKQPKKIRFWLPLLLVHWVSNLAALRPPKQLTCTHRSGSSSALDVASIKTRIGYPWWWQIFSHFFWFRTVGLQTKQRAKNMEMVKNESLPFFFLRESHVTCNMFRENICQPVITKWESLYVHAMRKNLQFARWCNLNRPSEAFVPKWLEEETPKGCRIRDVHQFKKCMTKNHATLVQSNTTLYQQPQKTNTSGCDWFFPWAFLHPKSVCFFLLFWLSGFRSTSRGTFRSQQIEKNTAEFRPCMVCCAKKTHWDTTSLPRKRNDILQ